MAEGHDLVGSECIRLVSLSSSVNDSCLVSELTPNNEYDTSIIKKNVKLAWVGDFQSIKCLVNK